MDESIREAGAPQVNFGAGPAVSFGEGATPEGGSTTPPAAPPPPATPPAPS